MMHERMKERRRTGRTEIDRRDCVGGGQNSTP